MNQVINTACVSGFLALGVALEVGNLRKSIKYSEMCESKVNQF